MEEIYDIFVYCGGKCGSTTLHNTFLKNNYKTMHLHSNDYYKYSLNKKDDIYNLIDLSSNNKDQIYIIDSYRLPIERKISSFFQNISIHLPEYKNMSIKELIDFFNTHLFYELEEYHSINEVLIYYNIPLFNNFDFKKKCNIKKHKNIQFIKVLFKDINNWNKIFSNIFKKKITIHPGNLTCNKIDNDIYIQFKEQYKVPKNYITDILPNDREFKIYNTKEEQNIYINKWLHNSV